VLLATDDDFVERVYWHSRAACWLTGGVTGTDLTVRSAGRLHVLLPYLLLIWITRAVLTITEVSLWASD